MRTHAHSYTHTHTCIPMASAGSRRRVPARDIIRRLGGVARVDMTKALDWDEGSFRVNGVNEIEFHFDRPLEKIDELPMYKTNGSTIGKFVTMLFDTAKDYTKFSIQGDASLGSIAELAVGISETAPNRIKSLTIQVPKLSYTDGSFQEFEHILEMVQQDIVSTTENVEVKLYVRTDTKAVKEIVDEVFGPERTRRRIRVDVELDRLAIGRGNNARGTKLSPAAYGNAVRKTRYIVKGESSGTHDGSQESNESMFVEGEEVPGARTQLPAREFITFNESRVVVDMSKSPLWDCEPFYLPYYTHVEFNFPVRMQDLDLKKQSSPYSELPPAKRLLSFLIYNLPRGLGLHFDFTGQPTLRQTYDILMRTKRYRGYNVKTIFIALSHRDAVPVNFTLALRFLYHDVITTEEKSLLIIDFQEENDAENWYKRMREAALAAAYKSGDKIVTNGHILINGGIIHLVNNGILHPNFTKTSKSYDSIRRNVMSNLQKDVLSYSPIMPCENAEYHVNMSLAAKKWNPALGFYKFRNRPIAFIFDDKSARGPDTEPNYYQLTKDSMEYRGALSHPEELMRSGPARINIFLRDMLAYIHESRFTDITFKIGGNPTRKQIEGLLEFIGVFIPGRVRYLQIELSSIRPFSNTYEDVDRNALERLIDIVQSEIELPVLCRERGGECSVGFVFKDPRGSDLFERELLRVLLGYEKPNQTSETQWFVNFKQVLLPDASDPGNASSSTNINFGIPNEGSSSGSGGRLPGNAIVRREQNRVVVNMANAALWDEIPFDVDYSDSFAFEFPLGSYGPDHNLRINSGQNTVSEDLLVNVLGSLRERALNFSFRIGGNPTIEQIFGMVEYLVEFVASRVSALTVDIPPLQAGDEHRLFEIVEMIRDGMAWEDRELLLTLNSPSDKDVIERVITDRFYEVSDGRKLTAVVNGKTIPNRHRLSSRGSGNAEGSGVKNEREFNAISIISVEEYYRTTPTIFVNMSKAAFWKDGDRIRKKIFHLDVDCPVVFFFESGKHEPEYVPNINGIGDGPTFESNRHRIDDFLFEFFDVTRSSKLCEYKIVGDPNANQVVETIHYLMEFKIFRVNSLTIDIPWYDGPDYQQRENVESVRRILPKIEQLMRGTDGNIEIHLNVGTPSAVPIVERDARDFLYSEASDIDPSNLTLTINGKVVSESSSLEEFEGPAVGLVEYAGGPSSEFVDNGSGSGAAQPAAELMVDITDPDADALTDPDERQALGRAASIQVVLSSPAVPNETVVENLKTLMESREFPVNLRIAGSNASSVQFETVLDMCTNRFSDMISGLSIEFPSLVADVAILMHGISSLKKLLRRQGPFRLELSGLPLNPETNWELTRTIEKLRGMGLELSLTLNNVTLDERGRTNRNAIGMLDGADVVREFTLNVSSIVAPNNDPIYGTLFQFSHSKLPNLRSLCVRLPPGYQYYTRASVVLPQDAPKLESFECARACFTSAFDSVRQTFMRLPSLKCLTLDTCEYQPTGDIADFLAGALQGMASDMEELVVEEEPSMLTPSPMSMVWIGEKVQRSKRILRKLRLPARILDGKSTNGSRPSDVCSQMESLEEFSVSRIDFSMKEHDLGVLMEQMSSCGRRFNAVEFYRYNSKCLHDETVKRMRFAAERVDFLECLFETSPMLTIRGEDPVIEVFLRMCKRAREVVFTRCRFSNDQFSTLLLRLYDSNIESVVFTKCGVDFDNMVMRNILKTPPVFQYDAGVDRTAPLVVRMDRIVGVARDVVAFFADEKFEFQEM